MNNTNCLILIRISIDWNFIENCIHYLKRHTIIPKKQDGMMHVFCMSSDSLHRWKCHAIWWERSIPFAWSNIHTVNKSAWKRNIQLLNRINGRFDDSFWMDVGSISMLKRKIIRRVSFLDKYSNTLNFVEEYLNTRTHRTILWISNFCASRWNDHNRLANDHHF